MSQNAPNTARMYDYYLGGKDNFEVDRRAAETVIERLPGTRPAARANRRFLVRAVQAMAEAGVDQFIDLGAGIPTSPNVHEVAREIVPEARVVYADNDPVVIAHNRALRNTDGVISVDADVRDVAGLARHPDLAGFIDFDRPVAVLLVAVLHFFGRDEARAVLDGVRGWAPSGSHVAITAAVTDDISEAGLRDISAIMTRAGASGAGLVRDDVTGLFDGLDLLDPGVTTLGRWRADEPDIEGLTCLCGVARVP